jgi:predicted phosphodiesterase
MTSPVIKLSVVADTRPDKAKAAWRAHPAPGWVAPSCMPAMFHLPACCRPSANCAIACGAWRRDWCVLRQLPLHQTLTFDGVVLGLTHSHGGLRNYIIGKFQYISEGYNLERFKPRLLESFPTAEVIVFGHTHRPVIRWANGKLFFNPGTTCWTDKRDISPSLGFLYLRPGGQSTAEISRWGNTPYTPQTPTFRHIASHRVGEQFTNEAVIGPSCPTPGDPRVTAATWQQCR